VANKQDGIVAIVSFALTSPSPASRQGILIGAGLALILYLYRTMQPRVAVLARHPDGTLRDAKVFVWRPAPTFLSFALTVTVLRQHQLL